MNTTEKIKLLQKLLERRYPADVYDKASKTSTIRLRVDWILNKLTKFESEVNNHE